MKKVYICKISSYILFWVAIAFIVVGVIMHVSSILTQRDLVAIYGSIIIFPLLSIIFWLGYYIEKSKKLIIDSTYIVFKYIVFTKPKVKYNVKEGLKIHFKDIEKFYSELSKGDLFFSADTTFYYIVLKNNTRIQFTLFNFGKKNEKEIYELLREKIENNHKERGDVLI